MEKNGRLVLIDAFAQIYRCFHAIPNLTNRRGEPTNALYGIAHFLLLLERSLPHEFGAVAFDKGKPAKRLALLPSYKATRPPTPAEMLSQLPHIRQWIVAAGWVILEEEGEEADDLIAAVVRTGESRETYIVSSDKDLAQLVGPNVFLAQPGSKGKFDILDPAAVETKFGIPPALIPDYLALVGDSSDNIPGVGGIGPKTAVALLQEYGTLEALLARVETVSRPAVRDKLREASPVLARNQGLVRLPTAIPQNWQGLGSLARRSPDWTALLDLARDHGFGSLVPTLEKARNAALNPTWF